MRHYNKDYILNNFVLSISPYSLIDYYDKSDNNYKVFNKAIEDTLLLVKNNIVKSKIQAIQAIKEYYKANI